MGFYVFIVHSSLVFSLFFLLFFFFFFFRVRGVQGRVRHPSGSVYKLPESFVVARADPAGFLTIPV